MNTCQCLIYSLILGWKFYDWFGKKLVASTIDLNFVCSWVCVSENRWSPSFISDYSSVWQVWYCAWVLQVLMFTLTISLINGDMHFYCSFLGPGSISYGWTESLEYTRSHCFKLQLLHNSIIIIIITIYHRYTVIPLNNTCLIKASFNTMTTRLLHGSVDQPWTNILDMVR